MIRTNLIAFCFIIILVGFFSIYAKCDASGENKMKHSKMILPEPKFDSSISIEETINKRRSIRKFLDTEISLSELSQLLWSAQGITTKDGRRTSPSAGATYPLEIYVAVRNVEKLKQGLYIYEPNSHSIRLIKDINVFNQIADATYQSQMCKGSSVLIIITAVLERTTSVYGERGIRYIYMEAGHSAQNLSLQGVALNIGSVLVGAFDDNKIINALSLRKGELPLYVIPMGKTDRYK